MSFKYSFSKFRTEGAAKKSNKSPPPQKHTYFSKFFTEGAAKKSKNQKKSKFCQKFPKNFQQFQKNFPKMSFKYSFSKFCAEGAAKKSNKSPLPKNTHILASSALKVLLRSQKDQKFKKTPKFSKKF